MRLQVGEKAPVFSKADLRGQRVDLATMRARPVWLGFFRFASCPLCNLRVHQMLAQWPRFQHRCDFVAVFQSPKERFDEFLDKHKPPFSVIADPEQELFTAYRLENSVLAALKPQAFAVSIQAMRAGIPSGNGQPKDGAALRVPADFVVGTDGVLSFVHYGASVADSVAFDVIDKALPAG